MTLDGVSYGMAKASSFSVHLTTEQPDPFASSPIAVSLCGLDVFEFDAEDFIGKKVCKACHRRAWDLGMEPPYRLPNDKETL
jgi:hypothetical protein